MGYSFGLALAIILILFTRLNTWVAIVIGALSGPLLEALLRPALAPLYRALRRRFGKKADFLLLKETGTDAPDADGRGMRVLVCLLGDALPQEGQKGYDALYQHAVTSLWNENTAFRARYARVVAENLPIRVCAAACGDHTASMDSMMWEWRQALESEGLECPEEGVDFIFQEAACTLPAPSGDREAVVCFFFDEGLPAEAEQDMPSGMPVYHLDADNVTPFQAKTNSTKKHKKSSRILRLVLILAAAIGIVVLGVYLTTEHFIPQSHYSKGERLLNEGDFDGAIRAFEQARYYKDASTRNLQARVLKGEALFEEGKYDEIPGVFERGSVLLGPNAGRSVLLAKTSTEIARKCIERGDLTGAAEALWSVADNLSGMDSAAFENVNIWINEMYAEPYEAYCESEYGRLFFTLLQELSRLGGTEASIEIARSITEKINRYDAKEEGGGVSWRMHQRAQYTLGLCYLDAGDTKAAADAFLAAGDTEDAAARLNDLTV